MGDLKSSEDTVLVMIRRLYSISLPRSLANRGYYTENKENFAPELRFSCNEKFPKVMVWVAISTAGVSQSYKAYKSAMNGVIYRKECLPRSKSFIEKHHSKENVIFWPDLASAHVWVIGHAL